MKRRRLLGLPVLLHCLAWTEGAPAEGDCSQNPIIGFAGEDIVLKPEVVGIPSYITWKKEENIVYEWSRGDSDPSDGSLILKSLSQSHGGVYTAEIQIGTKIEYKHFCLEVIGDCSKNPIIGFAGEEIVLKPEVVGIPSYITWKKEENIVHEWSRGNSDPSNSSLILKSLSQSHGGVYTAEIQFGTETEYRRFCLAIIEPPVLSCSDRSDDIQVNCTSPPQNGSHSLPVSYSWEARGEIFDRGQSITLQKNENLPEKITCIVSIYNVNASDSIVLSTFLTKGPDQERHRPGLWGVLVIPVLAVIGWLGFRRWKKGRSKHWFLRDNKKGKSQEDPGNADVPLNEMPTRNGSRRVSEDSKDNRRKGNDEGVPLKETPDDSKGVLENSEDDRREGNHIELEKGED